MLHLIYLIHKALATSELRLSMPRGHHLRRQNLPSLIICIIVYQLKCRWRQLRWFLSFLQHHRLWLARRYYLLHGFRRLDHQGRIPWAYFYRRRIWIRLLQAPIFNLVVIRGLGRLNHGCIRLSNFLTVRRFDWIMLVLTAFRLWWVDRHRLCNRLRYLRPLQWLYQISLVPQIQWVWQSGNVLDRV